MPMNRKHLQVMVVAVFATLVLALAGCGSQSASSSSAASGSATTSSSAAASASAAAPAKLDLAPGEYTVKFTTDSSMFHVNEANEDKGTLTVAEDGTAKVHVSLAGDGIVNLFFGTAEQAQAPGAALLEPTTDTVTYSDGTSEEVYGFDIPVPVLDQEYDVALVGEKGKWYDHKVKVSSPIAE